MSTTGYAEPRTGLIVVDGPRAHCTRAGDESGRCPSRNLPGLRRTLPSLRRIFLDLHRLIQRAPASLSVLLIVLLAVHAGAQTATFRPHPVGVPSALKSIDVLAGAAGTVSTIEVLTLGKPELDFAAAGVSTCADATLAAGQSCTVAVTFTPTRPGMRAGAVVLLDLDRRVLGTAYISGVGVGGLAVLVGNVPAALAAALDPPGSRAIDGAGNLYIADTDNNRISEMRLADGVIVTVAGNGEAGSSGDGGPAILAALNHPRGVSIDANGNLYIADTANHRIRRVDAAAGIIATIAGNGSIDPSTGAGGDSGDGGPAHDAEWNNPFAVAFDLAGDMYIPDSGNNAVRVVKASAGVVSPSSTITRFAAAGDGLGASVPLSSPFAVAVDAAGNVYIASAADGGVRKARADCGIITNLAPALSRRDGQRGEKSFVVENDGNAPLDIVAVTPDRNAALGAATTCAAGMHLEVDASCVIQGAFVPTDAGSSARGHIDILSAAPASPLDIELAGDTASAVATTTQIASSPNPSGFGQAVTLAAAVTSAAPAGALTGTVTFLDGATPLGSAVSVNASGQANLIVPALAVGVHRLTASYSGDTVYAAGVSPVVIQTVLEATSTTLSSSANPSALGQTVTLTAAVSPLGAGGVAPDGAVTFTDGSAALSTVALSPGGAAAYVTAGLTNGLHNIVAAYSGDAVQAISASVSNLLRQQVLVTAQVGLASSLNPSTFGTSVAFTASVTSSGNNVPTGSVDFLDGTTQLGAASLSGGVAIFSTSSLGIGSHSIAAAYLGDTSNSSATSGTVTQVINPPTTKAATSTSLSALPVPGVGGVPEALLSAVQIAHGSPAATGSVTFTDTFDGAALTLGTAAVNAAAMAGINPTLAVGSHVIVAGYSGDATNAASASAPFTLNVEAAATNVVLTSTPDPSIAASPIVFTVQVSGAGSTPTGIVTWFADGAPIGSATLGAAGSASVTVSSLAPGSHAVTANYAGDALNAPAAALAISQVVDTIPTVTTISQSTSADGIVTLHSSVSGSSGPTPTGNVTFMNGVTVLGTVQLDSSGTATLKLGLAGGTYSVIASYAGDPLHAPSTSNSLSISQALSTFNIALKPSTLNMNSSQTAITTVTLGSAAGFADTVALACAGLPTGVTCQFASASLTLTADGSIATQLTITTASEVADSGFAVAVLTLPLNFALILARFRRRSLTLTAALLPALFSCAAILLAGCSTVHRNKTTTPYTIQVTGIGVGTKAGQSVNLTLNISE